MNRRDELIHIAADIIRSSGIEKLSLRGVARRANIAAPSIYEYFKGKDQLIAAVRDRERGLLMEALAATQTAGQPICRLWLLMCSYYDFAVRHPSSFQLLFALPSQRTNIETPPDASSPYAPLFTECQLAIKNDQVQSFVGDDPEQLAYLIWATVHGCACINIGPLAATQMDHHEFATRAFDRSLKGLFLNRFWPELDKIRRLPRDSS